MAVMEEDLQRLWQLLAELSSQLTQNREQCEQLKKQAEDLKTQAIHTGTGYALKRFNVDLSKEQFESEVERMNAQLVVENQTLQHENRQLTILLKDYETTLEQIMTRFRTHAHSTQQHELDLTRYYESVLLSLMEKQQQSPVVKGLHPNGPTADGLPSAVEMDPNTFQAIQNISILIQRAMRELSGEEPYLNEADELESQQAELAASPAVAKTEHRQGPTVQTADGAGDSPAGITFQDPFHSASSKLKPDSGPHRRRSTSVIEFHPRLRDPASGGYVGKRHGSLSDYAMQSAIESERLRRENDYLREMLGIANDFSGQPETATSMAAAAEPGLAEPGEAEAHLAKLNSVVSEVIKEEEEEEEEDERLAGGAGGPDTGEPNASEEEHGTDEHDGGGAQRTEETGSPWRTEASDVRARDQDSHAAKMVVPAQADPGSVEKQSHKDKSISSASAQT